MVAAKTGIMLITDASGRIVFVSDGVENWSGYSVPESVGAKPGEVWGGNMDDSFYQEFWKTVAVEKAPFSKRLENRAKNGRLLPSLLTVLPILSSGHAKYFLAMQPDVSAWNAFESAFGNEWMRLSWDPRVLSSWMSRWLGIEVSVPSDEAVAAWLENTFVIPTRDRFASRHSDEAQLRLAKENIQEYAVIFEKYFPLVRAYLSRRLDQTAEAEDMAQDVFIKAMNGLSAYRPQNASYKTYLLRIAHNELLNRYRRHDVEQRYLTGTCPPAAINHLEDRDALERAVAKLSSYERQVLHGFYVEGRSVSDIAQQLEKTENAIKLTLSRSRKHLRDTF
ncbi:sigma-70 family RNA polymerase sigma factor [Candidatus Uhrbacteria bacterium]|nr:sigma-70 family RNA polymerase sigma factor [Candidatus Uhrbacteria bacterium]